MGRKPNLKARESILRQAEHQIHLRGYHCTKMEDIARCCKMTKANLFHHYGSKEDLALAVLDAKAVEYSARRVVPLCAQGDPVEAVRRMFKDAEAFFDGNGCKAGCFIGNIALEMSDVNEHFRKRASRFFDNWTQSMAECLKRSRDKGCFLPSLDPVAAAEALVSLYEGAIMLARVKRDASIFTRTGRVACAMLEQHKSRKHRR